MWTSVSDHAREQNAPVGHSLEPLAVHGATHWPVAMPQLPHSVPVGHGWLASQARPRSWSRALGPSEAQLLMTSRMAVRIGRIERMLGALRSIAMRNAGKTAASPRRRNVDSRGVR